MRKFEQKQIASDVLVSVECDRCHAVCDADDDMNLQEWVLVGGCGGFNSKYWGDDNTWMVDLCEKCQHELFRDFAQIN